jgi:hypothetical protein
LSISSVAVSLVLLLSGHEQGAAPGGTKLAALGVVASTVQAPAVTPVAAGGNLSNVAVNLVLMFSGHRPGSFSGGNDPAALRTAASSVPVFLTPSAPTENRKLYAYLEAASKALDPRVRGALLGIDEMPRRILALKYYVRKTGDVRSSWTWTPKQIMRYKRSMDYLRAVAEVEKVKAKFSELNPGYTLKVNTEVRTLTEQIRLWNETGSIIATGQGIYAACVKALRDTTYPEQIEKKDLLRFIRFLGAYKAPVIPTVAVPGFSQHGQLRAFDFVIWQGDKIAAGTDAESVGSVWDRSGWTAKLNDAITQASPYFTGPLPAPREPWHYTYTSKSIKPAAAAKPVAVAKAVASAKAVAAPAKPVTSTPAKH